VIGSIQDTREVYTVFQRKHVGRFVDQHFATPSQQDLLIVLPSFFAVKGGIIPGEAKHPDTFPKRGLAEDEIPRGVGIEILHGDSHKAKGVGWNPLLEERQNITGQDLSISR
jgi:hypothetical protein